MDLALTAADGGAGDLTGVRASADLFADFVADLTGDSLFSSSVLSLSSTSASGFGSSTATSGYWVSGTISGNLSLRTPVLPSILASDPLLLNMNMNTLPAYVASIVLGLLSSVLHVPSFPCKVNVKSSLNVSSSDAPLLISSNLFEVKWDFSSSDVSNVFVKPCSYAFFS